MASEATGAALRALPGQWKQHLGYRPLLAESVTDPKSYSGTCYRPSNRETVGQSAGSHPLCLAVTRLACAEYIGSVVLRARTGVLAGPVCKADKTTIIRRCLEFRRELRGERETLNTPR